MSPRTTSLCSYIFLGHRGGLYVVYIWMRYGASVVWLHSLPLMNGFNKTEAAFFSCRLCFLRAILFISLIYIDEMLLCFSGQRHDPTQPNICLRQQGRNIVRKRGGIWGGETTSHVLQSPGQRSSGGERNSQ